MIRICLCDDEPKWMNHIKSYVENYFARHESLDYSLECFEDAMQLIDYLEAKGNFDIYLLDVYMPLTLGTDLARELREKGDESRIVFLTTSKSHAIDAFAVRASDYVLKPFGQDRIDQLLDSLIPQLAIEENKYFTVKTSDGFVNIKYSKISYIELQTRRLLVHTCDGGQVQSIIIRGKFEDEIGDIAEEKSFVHCQKSYLVNMKYIHKLQNTEFVMESQDVVPISKRMYQDTKKKYMDYLLRKEI